MGIEILGHVISNVGVKKFTNEDNYLMNGAMNENSRPIRETEWKQKKGNLLYAAVFDGMGGGEGGQLASKIAAEEFRKVLDPVSDGVSWEMIDRLASQAFLNANRRIVEERKKHPVLGTTATLLCIREHHAKIFHLGDSRAYLLRENKLGPLTKDQTMATLKIDAGIYTPEHPDVEKDRNMLTEYVGADETMQFLKPLESRWISLNPGERLLLCSDGLYHVCQDKEIEEMLQRDEAPEKLADQLICTALEKGGTDNITCMVVTVEDI